MPDQVQTYLDARRQNRTAESSDGFATAARGDRYGNAFVRNAAERRELVATGVYRLATNPTPGTGIIGHASLVAYDATKPYMVIKNNSVAGSGKRLHLDRIRLLLSVAGAAATAWNFQMRIETASNRYSSGGSTITPTNPNSGESASTDALVYAGAVTAAAAGTERLCSSGLMRQGLGAAGDQFVFGFGEMPIDTVTPATGTTVGVFCIPVAPVALDPQHSFLLHIYGPSLTTAPTYEFEVGYWIE